MKKIKIILSLLMITTVLAGCSLTNNGSSNSSTSTSASTNEYIITTTETSDLLSAVNNGGLIYFYINGSNLGNAVLSKVSELASEYKTKVYVVNVNDAKYSKDTTDDNVKAVYAKLGDKLKFIDSSKVLMTPVLYYIKDGAVSDSIVGVNIEKLDANNITNDNLNAIKEYYRPLFEANK